jgi:hypothetical protein
MARLISCTEKARSRDIPELITTVGGMKKEGTLWVRWRKSQADAIAEIESGDQIYYVNLEGSTPNLIIAVHKGAKYLKAPLDREAPTTLLSLPDCPQA